MMNVLGICLVVISVATAGVWSPSPDKKLNPGEEIILKEGHRIIVVEYEKEGLGLGNTKVSISPQEDAQATIKEIEIDDKTSLKSDTKEKLSSAAGSAVENVKEKMKEASTVLSNSEPPSTDRSSGPRELICDAIGKCKHKITGALGRAKEKAHEVKEEAKEKATEVKEEVTEAVETVRDAFGKAKETVSQKAHGIEEKVKKSVDKAKDTAKTAVDKSKTIGEDIAKTASEKLETARQKAKEGKEKAEKEKVKNDLRQRGREAVKYVVSSNMVGLLMEIVQLVGFCTAYGMCVWITFASSYILARALPVQLLGMVQTKMYSVYFRAMAFSIGVALLGYFFNQRKRLVFSKAEMLQLYNLVVSLLMVVANLNYLEPRATKVIFERMKVEKEEGRGNIGLSAEGSAAPPVAERLEEIVKSRIDRLNVRIKKLNSCSSFLNILTLMALSWHLVYLAQRLHLTCS